MEKMLYTKSNKVVIIMTILYFSMLPTIFLTTFFESSILNIYFIYIILYIVIRYIILIKNFIVVFFKNINNLNVKLVFYISLFSFIFYIYALTTSFSFFIYTSTTSSDLLTFIKLNKLLLLLEVLIITIFNTPVLYKVTKLI